MTNYQFPFSLFQRAPAGKPGFRFPRDPSRKTVKSALAQLLFRVLPIPVVMLLLIFNHRVRHRVGLTQEFVVFIGKRRGKYLKWLRSDFLTHSLPGEVIEILYALRHYDEVVELARRHAPDKLSCNALTVYLDALFELRRFKEAEEIFDRWAAAGTIHATISAENGNEHLWVRKARLHLVNGGDESASERTMWIAAQLVHSYMRPHQNLSAREPELYDPHELDYVAGPAGLLYDAYNYLGQRVTHVGAGHLGPGLYAKALCVQRALRRTAPAPSGALRDHLGRMGIEPENLRLAPVEWTAQIGHLGMLDLLIRMRTLGWWQGDLLVLGRGPQIANRPCLDLFQKFCGVAVESETVSAPVWRELISLQRFFGMAFNAWEYPDGEVVPWQEAGAVLMREWESRDLGHPLREVFDQVLSETPRIEEEFAEIRAQWGMAPDDWFVCLHMRDSSFYGEPEGTGQTHRNAGFDNYLEAVRHITGQGGWVVRMGGREAPPLPKIPRVIDYAHSPFKAPIVDLDLVRRARYFIGTTSGMTNLAISFGLPCALVNCISTDAQPWSSSVRFALKPIRDAEDRWLSQRALTTAPHRWDMFTAETIRRAGLTSFDNSPDEILETVKEVEALAAGASPEYAASDDGLMEKWRDSLDLPHFYGAGLPSRYYLDKYRESFLDGSRAHVPPTTVK